MLLDVLLRFSVTAGIRFSPPATAGQNYYATGGQGLDASHALIKDTNGWFGTSDSGKSWEVIEIGAERGDIGSAVLHSGNLHTLGDGLAPVDKDSNYRQFNGSNSTYISHAAGEWTSTPTKRPVVFRGIPAPGFSCGNKDHKFGCPFRDSGRGYVTLPGGDLVMSIIVWWGGTHANPNKKLAAVATSIASFRSSDGGFTWDYAGKIIDAADAPKSEEGPNENDMVLLKDGKTIMCVIRLDAGDGELTHRYVPYVISKSTDGGRSWSKAKSLPKNVGCARPRLMRTQSGAVVLSGGRTGPRNRDVLLWVNQAGDGEEWVEHSITYQHNKLETNSSLWFTAAVNDSTARESTSYTSLVRTSSESGFLIYARHLPPAPDQAFAMPFTITAGEEAEKKKPLPPAWPDSWDSEYHLCCEHGTDSWHADWHDHQVVSYDWTSKRMTVAHTDMYGHGPGQDWTTPNGTILFESDNSTVRFKAPCCIFMAGVGVIQPTWAQTDTPIYLGTETINVSAVFGGGTKLAHKWSNPGALGPADTNFYWQLEPTSVAGAATNASFTAQWGASDSHARPSKFWNISAGYFTVTRPITSRPQDAAKLTPSPQCAHAMAVEFFCPPHNCDDGKPAPAGGCKPVEGR